MMIANIGHPNGASLQVQVANTLWERLRGLLGRPMPGSLAGMLIRRCHVVHTLGMAYAIDVVFLDADWHVVGVVHRVPPGCWRVAAPRGRGAAQTLELHGGEAMRIGLVTDATLYPSMSMVAFPTTSTPMQSFPASWRRP